MPLYEYKCENCGQKFEVMQKFADAPLTTHEACGGGPVMRLLSAPALQFKGSGWYITDYAKSSTSSPSSNGSKNEGSSSGSGDKGGSSSSSTTPAATTSASADKGKS